MLIYKYSWGNNEKRQKLKGRGPFRMGEKMVLACAYGKDWSVDKWRH